MCNEESNFTYSSCNFYFTFLKLCFKCNRKYMSDTIKFCKDVFNP